MCVLTYQSFRIGDFLIVDERINFMFDIFNILLQIAIHEQKNTLLYYYVNVLNYDIHS